MKEHNFKTKKIKKYNTKKRKLKIKKIKFFTMLFIILIFIAGILNTIKRLERDIERIHETQVSKITDIENIEVRQIIGETIREVTAYNVGDVKQTDSTPCIGAYSQVDLCEEVARGRKVCAANFVPLGTELLIEAPNGWKFGCIVWDRMNEKHPHRVDIAMNLWEYDRAVSFGKQKLTVKILGKVQGLQK